ncbi:hypothetical protein HHI36_003242 [Cryptolaemus montrouzieri]|uniref:Uncharacterized protein n=1 Tax=Cryptolaemus montrouzieri TaxID=559131 RepID=A0ABD2PD39_9CUCU
MDDETESEESENDVNTQQDDDTNIIYTEFLEEIKKLRKSVKFMSDKFNDLQEEMKELRSLIKSEKGQNEKNSRRVQELEAKVIGVNATNDSFVCTRMKSNGRTNVSNKPIIMKTKTAQFKKEILEKSKEYGRNLKLPNATCNNTIYINKDLTPATQFLYEKARKELQKDQPFQISLGKQR